MREERREEIAFMRLVDYEGGKERGDSSLNIDGIWGRVERKDSSLKIGGI